MKLIDKIMIRQQQLSSPIGDEAPVLTALERLGHIDLTTLVDESMSNRTSRAQLRYLAALFPDLNLHALAHEVCAIIDNPSLSEADCRIILDGRSLSDPMVRTREIPLEKIQALGKLLQNGVALVEAARRVGLARNTGRAIDDYLGLSEAHEARQLNSAIELVREGASSRDIARALGVSSSTGHRLQVQAIGVLRELGEVK